MSAGPGARAGGAPAPGPVTTDRAHILSRLEAERRQAVGCFEDDRAAELAAQIRDLSQGSPDNPRRETTAERKPDVVRDGSASRAPRSPRQARK